jgi:limonene-1,2-epoxide hydrolase
MDERGCRLLVEGFWAAMQANDWEGAAALLCEDVVLDYPQSGERIRGRANIVAVNRDYPTTGRWRFDVHRILIDATAQAAVSDVSVANDEQHARVVSFFAFGDGLVRRMTEFWPEPFAAADWRAGFVERIGDPGRSSVGRECLPM